MDMKTAVKLYSQDCPVTLMVDGRRVDHGVVKRIYPPDVIEVTLPTRIDEPDQRKRLPLDRVEIAP